MRKSTMVLKIKYSILLILSVLLFTGCQSQQNTQETQETQSKVLDDMKDKIKIAITIDDGPDGNGTTAYLEGLADLGIPATFFVVGSNVEKSGMQLQSICNQGYEIGNHSYSHDYLNEKTEEEVRADILKCQEQINAYADISVGFFRAPYFAYSENLRNAADCPIIHAAVTEGNTYEQTLENLKNAKDGDIILMHTWNMNSLLALKTAVPELLENNYAFLTVSDLFAACEVEGENGKVYGNVYQPW